MKIALKKQPGASRSLFLYLITFLISGCTGKSDVTVISPAIVPNNGSAATISYVSPTTYFTKGSAATAITPTVTGSPSSITISPALPAGLNLNSTTGVISGTPSIAIAPTTYTLTAHATDGSTATSTVTFEVAIPFTVNTTTDASDATPGDQVCATAGAQCSLRAALEEGAALPGILSVITLPANTYQPTSTLNINSRVILLGNDNSTTFIDGNGILNKIISIANFPVRLESVTIQNGGSVGAATVDGVGIESVSDNLYIKSCVISSNAVNTTVASVTINGVGLKATSASVTGTITLEDTYVGGNTINLGAGVTLGTGKGTGAYLSANTVTLIGGSFVGNNSNGGNGAYATYGGGIYVLANNLSVTATAFTINQSISNANNDRGGGIYYDGTGNSALFSDISCTSNRAKNGGGCMWYNATTPVTIYNSSFTSDSDTNSSGGGVTFGSIVTATILSSSFDNGGTGTIPFHIHTSAGGTYTIKNSTFNTRTSSPAFNVLTTSAANIYFENDTFRSTSTGPSIKKAASAITSVYLKNSILEKTGAGSACNGDVTHMFSQGYNLARDNSCTFLGGGGDITNTDPQISAPTGNGGNGVTCALAAGSPARDAIPLGSCALTTDGRGIARPQGGACDIGAYEY